MAQPDATQNVYIYIDYKDIICDKPVEEQGAMSFVITGIHGKHRVILKKPLSKEDKEWNIQEFENELKHLLSIRNKNVVALHGITKLPKDDGWWLVLEYCEKGNLSDVLGLNKEAKDQPSHPIERKFQFAIDIASGMNICHINTPPILHRDLKNANIFVNSEWICKVGDFGLSTNLKHRNWHGNLATLGAAGTSQYYPPEILRGEFLDDESRMDKTLSSKSDVWAFGLMLWEIYTQKKAWKDFLDEIKWNAAVFSDELCNKGRLPEMDNTIPPQIQKIITLALKTNGDDRPSFGDLVDQLTTAQIDFFLDKDAGFNAFWKGHWQKDKWESSSKVSWDKFKHALIKFLSFPTPNSPIFDILYSRLLGGEGDHVTLPALQKVIDWFGPLKSSDGKNILQRLQDYKETPWFFLELPSEAVGPLLKNQSKGTYLVRLNEGKSDATVRDAPWTLSYVNNKKVVKNVRIKIGTDGTLTFKDDEIKITEAAGVRTLPQLIQKLTQEHSKEFKACCPGHTNEKLAYT